MLSLHHFHLSTKKYLAAGSVALSLFFGQCSTGVHGKNLDLHGASQRQTYSLYQRNGCLTSEEAAYGKEIIKGLNYPAERAFRLFCRLPALSFTQYQQVWSLLLNYRLSYGQVLCLEQWCTVEPVDFERLFEAVPVFHTLSHTAEKTLLAFLELPDITAQFSTELIPVLNGLSLPMHLALRSMITVQKMTAARITPAILELQLLSDSQAMALANYAKIPEMQSRTLFDGLSLIARLRQQDAWNAHFLFSAPELNWREAWDWLVAFFALPADLQEEQYFRFTDQQKNQLLHGMYRGGEKLIRQINDLHSVTDRFGMEFSNTALHRLSLQELQRLFFRLAPVIRYRWNTTFSKALNSGNRPAAVTVLRQATSEARSHVAASLTSANIYALLAQGGELYDSSFRDILVPVLQQRIVDEFQGNTLYFFQAADPAHVLVSSFITSCAQKGKLASFLPSDEQQQQQVLDLVANSAFGDPAALLVFSASMHPLLKVLQPTARNYLVGKMVAATHMASPPMARLLAVTLQYALRYHGDMLSAFDRQQIEKLVERYGRISFADYLKTPFNEWKADNRLVSLSLFYPDDDGKRSFRSFTDRLLQQGYVWQEAATLPENVKQRLQATLQPSSVSPPHTDMGRLFSSMQRTRERVTFSKMVNGITLCHTLSVYADPLSQQQQLLHFFTSGHEMLIQRGHSYWRDEQIIEPMSELVRQGLLTPNMLEQKQRFLSLGSCGGIKAYSRLNALFDGSVDVLATIGTGLAEINDPYNIFLFEFIAAQSGAPSWDDVSRGADKFFSSGRGHDYLQPGSLTAILHKILHTMAHDMPSPTES